MNDATNDLGPPLGAPVPDWTPPPRPPREKMAGAWCRLEPLDPDRHAPSLHAANRLDAAGAIWTYMSYGPFATFDDYRAWAQNAAAGEDPLFFAVIDNRTGAAANPAAHMELRPDRGAASGVGSYLRIDSANGVIEIGHLNFAPPLQRTPAATEAVSLMMARAFALGYRRVEWKCNALNAASRRAALRLGFSFEGVFRQAMVVKGRNRDSAWYAVIDQDWPAVRDAHRRWLDPLNFDSEGRQLTALSSLTSPLLKARG